MSLKKFHNLGAPIKGLFDESIHKKHISGVSNIVGLNAACLVMFRVNPKVSNFQ